MYGVGLCFLAFFSPQFRSGSIISNFTLQICWSIGKNTPFQHHHSYYNNCEFMIVNRIPTRSRVIRGQQAEYIRGPRHFCSFLRHLPSPILSSGKNNSRSFIDSAQYFSPCTSVDFSSDSVLQLLPLQRLSRGNHYTLYRSCTMVVYLQSYRKEMATPTEGYYILPTPPSGTYGQGYYPYGYPKVSIRLDPPRYAS